MKNTTNTNMAKVAPNTQTSASEKHMKMEAKSTKKPASSTSNLEASE